MKTLGMELRLFFGERATWALLVLFAATVAYGMVNGSRAAESARALGQDVESRNDEWYAQVAQALEVQPVAARDVAGRPTEAFLPPAPLPALAVGQSDLLPGYEVISLFRLEQPAQTHSELENPARLMAGRFDLAFVLVWLLPLFLLAATFDLCAGDREAGTLRLVLAQGAQPRGWLARRALARGAPLLALATVGVAATSMMGAAEGSASRVALAVAVVLAYGLFWLAIAALVNSIARTAAAAATAAGAIWVVFVLVLPTLLNVVMESLHPSPSRAELVAEARAASGDAEQRGNELLSSFYRDHPELAPPGMQADMMGQMLAVQDEVGRAMEPVREAFTEAVRKQQGLVDLWRFASPAIAVHEALADLAGTGYWRHRVFQDQVEAFKDELRAYYSPKFHKREPLTRADLSSFPVFEFEEEAPSEWRGRVLTAIVGILLLAAAAAAVAGMTLSARKLAA